VNRFRTGLVSRSTVVVAFLTISLFSGCAGTTSSTGGGGGTPTPAAITVAMSLAATSVQIGMTQAFTATVANDSANKGVIWALSGTGCSVATCGTVAPASSASGVAVTYTAPGTMPNPGTVTLTATSVADATKSATTTITLTSGPPAVAVTLSLATATVAVNGTQAFTATVTGDSGNKGVTWAVAGTGCTAATCGAVAPTSSASGTAVTYTAPAAVPNPASVTLTATSVADSTKTASATITITAASGSPISVALTPTRGGLVTAQSLNFTATVTNDVGGQGVTWTTTGGTFSVQAATTATFVAPATAGSITVTATSKADVTKSASATIGITDFAGAFTYHNNLSRDGSNPHEFALTPSNVTTASFGKLFSCNADGAIYAQPLWAPKVNIGGGTHNVIVAATMRDSVYVFDADANPCVTYWNKNLIPAGETYGNWNDLGSADIYPDIGILGTPVVDPASGTIYVVTKTKDSGGVYHQRIHALGLIDGSEKFSGPMEISSSITVPGTGDGSSNGTVPFNPKTENQRSGLALVNGVVYVAWASHGDNGPYHGWIIGYNAANLAQAPIVFNDTPNGSDGGIWMSGGAPAADSANNLYAISGNGSFDKTAPRTNYGMAFMKLSTAGALSVADFFSPLNEDTLSSSDLDLGAGGAAVLVDATAGPFPHLVVGGGKDHQLFVLNRDGMGGYSGSANNVVQTLDFGNGIFATAAFWNNTLYLAGSAQLKAFTLNPATSQFSVAPSSQSTATFGFPGSSPTVSSSGTTNGIVWAMSSNAFGTSNSTAPPNGTPKAAGPTILHAYDATNLNTELWNSTQAAGGRDTAGNAVKFTVPTVANGRVYVGTRGSDDSAGNGTVFGQINVYGLLPN
jgi:hypothetical protein